MRHGGRKWNNMILRGRKHRKSPGPAAEQQDWQSFVVLSDKKTASYCYKTETLFLRMSRSWGTDVILTPQYTRIAAHHGNMSLFFIFCIRRCTFLSLGRFLCRIGIICRGRGHRALAVEECVLVDDERPCGDITDQFSG